MPLLTANSAFGSGRRRRSYPQRCYLHRLRTLSDYHNTTQIKTQLNLLPNPQNPIPYNAFQLAIHPKSAPSHGGIHTPTQYVFPGPT